VAAQRETAGLTGPTIVQDLAAMTDDTLEIEDRGDDGFVVCGQLDLDTVSMFRNGLRRAIRPGAEIVLDFGEVTFLDSSGLQALVTIASEVAPGSVTIRQVRRGPLSVLSLTGLLEIDGLVVEPAEDTEG
jgi:anti-anti-sigma factor